MNQNKSNDSTQTHTIKNKKKSYTAKNRVGKDSLGCSVMCSFLFRREKNGYSNVPACLPSVGVFPRHLRRCCSYHLHSLSFLRRKKKAAFLYFIEKARKG